MNLCVKTGARVLIDEYGGVAAADLFLVGSALIAYLEPGPAQTSLCYDAESKAEATHQVNLGVHGHYHQVRGVVTAPLYRWKGELILPNGRTIDAHTLARERELSIPCPQCQGHGGLDVRHPSGDPQLETWERCGLCGGVGTVEPDQDQLDDLVEDRQHLLDALKAILLQITQGPVLERDACITQGRAAYARKPRD